MKLNIDRFRPKEQKEPRTSPTQSLKDILDEISNAALEKVAVAEKEAQEANERAERLEKELKDANDRNTAEKTRADKDKAKLQKQIDDLKAPPEPPKPQEKKPKLIDRLMDTRHPFRRSMKGQSLCVNFKMIGEDRYKTEEYWRPLDGATLMAMGYMPAEGYKTEGKYVTTDVYVKFDGFEMYPCIRMNEDGKLYEVQSLETASTLYDYFTSNAESEFMDGMKAKKSTAIDNKMLIIGIVLVAGLVIAGWLISH